MPLRIDRVVISDVLAFGGERAYVMNMTVFGKVQNGVIVLPPGTELPEGASVTVDTVPDGDDLAAVINALAKPRHHLPADFALNHGHYIGGEPKK